jgi:hypothetical protein
MKYTRIFALPLLLAALAFGAMAQVTPNLLFTSNPENVTLSSGLFLANAYSYAGASLYSGNAATGSASITIRGGYVVLNDGRSVMPFAVGVPLVISDAQAEMITPTAVSGCYRTQGMNQDGITVTCTITASFTYLHGIGAQMQSATNGLAEAALDAFNWGGGQVILGPGWKLGLNTSCSGCFANQAAVMAALPPFSSVGIEDMQGQSPVYYNVLPSTTTFMAAPSALTSATAFSSLTVAGSASYAAGTIHVGYECVDVMGNPGPISADYSFTDTSAKAIQFTAPPAQTGCVGYIPAIGLESGAANHEYVVALLTQPTVLGATPVSSGVCTLTQIETITPACAITNAVYGQTGVGAVVAAYPVVTSPQTFQLGGVSSTSYYAPNTNAHTTYAYVPGAHLGVAGIVSNSEPSTVSAALGSTVPFVLTSLAIPPGFMNTQGRALQICGQIYDSAGGANTVTAVQFWWDAQGSNVTTGIPVKVGGPTMTATITSAASAYSFCQTIETTVPSASATGGSLRATNGFLGVAGSSAGANPFFGINNTVAAIGSLNLAENAQIDIVYVETTATTDTPILTNLTVQVLD